MTFTDGLGREWVISINATSIKRCRVDPGVDLAGLTSEGFKPLGQLLGDPVALADVLYVISDGPSAGVSPEEFGKGLFGDGMGRATDAFLGELTGFHSGRTRTELENVLKASKALQDRVMDDLAAQIEAIDVDAAVAQILNKTA